MKRIKFNDFPTTVPIKILHRFLLLDKTRLTFGRCPIIAWLTRTIVDTSRKFLYSLLFFAAILISYVGIYLAPSSEMLSRHIFLRSQQSAWAYASNVDLILEKNFAEEFAIAGGEPQQLLLQISNQGDEAANFVRVTDKVDGRLSVTAVDCGNVNSVPGTNLTRGNFVDCLYNRLPPTGGSASITITFAIDAGTDAAIVSNTASAEDETGHRRNAFDNLEIVEDGSLTIDMSFRNAYVEAGGGPYTLNLATRNSGFSHRTNVNVTNTLDHRLLVSEVHCGASGIDRSRGQIVDCIYDLLPAGSIPQTIMITYSVKSDQTNDSVINVATALDDDGNGAQAFGSLNIIGDVTTGVEKPDEDPPISPDGPALIELVYFMVKEVEGQPDQRQVEWQTSTEQDTLGFNILRGTQADTEVAAIINSSLIPALGGNGEAHGGGDKENNEETLDQNVISYHFEDISALAEVEYFYWLVEIEIDQTENIYGPIQLMPPERSLSLNEATANQKIFMPIIIRGSK